jgi:dienelactone hydrolase
MKYFLKYFSVALFTLISSIAFGRTVNLPRTDGSLMRVYIENPAQSSFAVVVLLQGSVCSSSYPMFSSTVPALLHDGFGVIAVEKYGLDENTTSCPQSYLDNNTIQSRILDHLQLVAYLRHNLSGWNKRVAWAGGSEGGQVASLVAPLVPETAALIMLASGGGMTMAEELPLVIPASMKKKGGSQTDIQAALDDMNKRFVDIKANPTSSLEWLSDGQEARNTYKYWNSILWIKALPLLESLNVPIYIAHGTADTSCPFESSKMIADRFAALGKVNLTFKIYPGLEHNWTDSNGTSHGQQVMGEVFQWLKSNM